MLNIDNLYVSFSTHEGRVEAVRGVFLQIEPGEVVALVGESGCGKSATAKAILQLIGPESGKIEKGSIFFQNEDLLTKSRKEIRSIRGREISMIFQDPLSSLNPTMPIGKQILEGCASRGTKQTVCDLLKTVGIPHPERRFYQYPHELSGGQRQRVMIAIALASEPKLLVADEPTTALDVTVQKEVLELIQREQKKRGMSVLLITHDLGIVAKMADKVAVMYGGKIVESGSVEQVFHSPFHPYTQGLLNSVPRLDTPKGQLQTIEGAPPSLINPPNGCPFCARCDHAMRICDLKMPLPSEVQSNHFASCWQTERDS